MREDKEVLPDSALRARFYGEAKQTELCFHPDAPTGCSSTISRAHTVRKASGLLKIAEKGHVLSGRNSIPSTDRNRLERIGINEASTFRGFCSRHDNNTFRAAEFAEKPSKLAAFLLAYRALCYEIYMKKVAVPTLEFFRDHLDAGKHFEDQAFIQSQFAGFLHSMRVGYDEHSRLKRDWDEALVSGDLTKFGWSYARFGGVLPIVTSGVFFPETDFLGRKMQELTAPLGSLALMGFNVVPVGGQTCGLFGWLDGKNQNNQFVETFEMIDNSVLASALIQFCFDTSDNIFVKPSWWAALPEVPKSYLLMNLRNSTPGEKQIDGLVPRQPPVIEIAVVDRATERPPKVSDGGLRVS